jgi:hypothetical protein
VIDGEEMVFAGCPNWLAFVWLSQKKDPRAGTAFHGGGYFGLCSNRLTVHPTLLMLRKLPLPPISNSEDHSGPSCGRVPARGLPPALSGATVARFPGSIFSLPPHEEGPSAASSTVSSSPAAQTMAPVLAPWHICWRMMREKNEPKVSDGEGEEAEEESARYHGRDGLRTQTQRAYAGGDFDAKALVFH